MGRWATFRGRWLSRRAFLFHFMVAVIVPGCLIACWWQATRAATGNILSWAYAVEWPIFSIIAVVAWWQLIHEDPVDVALRRMTDDERALFAGAPPTGQEDTVSDEDTVSADNGATRIEVARQAAIEEAYRAYLPQLLVRPAEPPPQASVGT